MAIAMVGSLGKGAIFYGVGEYGWGPPFKKTQTALWPEPMQHDTPLRTQGKVADEDVAAAVRSFSLKAAHNIRPQTT